MPKNHFAAYYTRRFNSMFNGREYTLTRVCYKKIEELAQNAVRWKFTKEELATIQRKKNKRVKRSDDIDFDAESLETNIDESNNEDIDVNGNGLYRRASPLEKSALIFKSTHGFKNTIGWENSDLLQSLKLLNRERLVKYRSRSL